MNESSLKSHRGGKPYEGEIPYKSKYPIGFETLYFIYHPSSIQLVYPVLVVDEIELTEGATEVSKHNAEYNHIEGDFEMKAISYDKNFYTRGIREAIEIRKKNPSLNSDNGRYFLPKIYDLVLSRDRNPSQDNGTV